MPDVDTKNNLVVVSVDEKVFPRQVSVAAAYRFLDRCYVRLARGAKGQLTVAIKAKAKASEAGLATLADEFENELLQQLMRQQIAAQTEGLREVLVGRALLSAEPVEAFGPESDAAGGEGDIDYLDDPLGIAVPWEEKYGDDQGEGEQEDS